MSVTSIGSPEGPSRSTCGYCSPPGRRSTGQSSYHSAGLDARLLSCEVSCLVEYLEMGIYIPVTMWRYTRRWLTVGGGVLVNAPYLLCERHGVLISSPYAGTWCYKPNLRMSCCPQYTIKYFPSTDLSAMAQSRLELIDWMLWSSNLPRVSESCWIGMFSLVSRNSTYWTVKLEPFCNFW